MNITTKILLVIGCVCILWMLKNNYDKSVESQALVKYNNEQLQKVIDSANRNMEITRNIQNSLNEVQNSLSEINKVEDTQSENIMEKISGSEGVDRDSSGVLKDTMRELSTLNGN